MVEAVGRSKVTPGRSLGACGFPTRNGVVVDGNVVIVTPSERDTPPVVIAKKRILFVDDDAVFLACLQYLLRKDRERWDMTFVLDGRLGLDECRKQPFDLVVSDLAIPGMIDGATFLTVITKESPATGLIVLSGHVDRGAILSMVPEIRQVLPKPCTIDDLRGAIERAIDSLALLRDSRDQRD